MRKLVVIVAIFLATATTAQATVYIAPSSKGLPHAVKTANRAWQWFHTPSVQCETNHEGAWDTDTGIYRGKFQMDYAFQTTTKYGKKLTKRFGLASKWPRIAQVVHAYTVWLNRSWKPWPPYYKFCYGKWPMYPSQWRR